MIDEMLEKAKSRIEFLKRTKQVQEFIACQDFVSAAERFAKVSTKNKQISIQRESAKQDQGINLALEEILSKSDKPLSLRRIMGGLSERGIKVSGKNPNRNIGARLNHSDRFVSVGRDQWTLSKPTPQAPPPYVSQNTSDNFDDDVPF